MRVDKHFFDAGTLIVAQISDEQIKALLNRERPLVVDYNNGINSSHFTNIFVGFRPNRKVVSPLNLGNFSSVDIRSLIFQYF